MEITPILAMSLGNILWTALIGLLAGALARFIMPGKQTMNIIFTMLLGIAGAFVGGFLGDKLGIGGGGTLWQILLATGGALILLIVVGFIAKLKK